MKAWTTFACAMALACGPATPRPEHGDGDVGDGDGEGGDGEGDDGGESPPHETIRTQPSEMLERLRNGGLDPANLPAMDALTQEQKQNVIMPAFARALGVECIHCHEYGNYATPTKNRAIAKVMYEELVRKLRHEDGSALFCDSCHQREPTFLPEGEEAVGRFMRLNYVDPLERIDAGDHSCKTCHGDPPRWHFLPTTPG